MLADARRPEPDLAAMRRLVDVLGQPQSTAPVIHVTGTNGKTSTARCITSLLAAKGLRAGAFTSPHLETINERIAADGEPISDDDLVTVLGEIASVEPLLGDGLRLTWFEILAGAAMVWFADRPVDVSVLEVGMGGRWDATNVAEGAVAIVTNVGTDHLEFLGPTREDVAGEKAGIVKPGATLVLGERDPGLRQIFDRQDPAQVWLAGVEYGCTRNDPAVGGRVLDIHTPGATYDGVWLDLHGAYQGENFAAALAACEAFFGAPLDDRLVREAAGTVRSPGRLEIVGREPLVVLDGAKNLEGAHRAAEAVAEEFGAATSEILVVGMLRGKDPAAMLEALGVRRARLVIACPAPSPRTQPASVVAEAARALGVEALEAESVPEALDVAFDRAGAEDLVLVTGSLYVVGAARAALAVGSKHE
ncbi:MAG TPA: Mur ligase family protein [Acidimicrobiales bacterium]|nr:Mur ligase family protein [Acidimicrobiales bacterium]